MLTLDIHYPVSKKIKNLILMIIYLGRNSGLNIAFWGSACDMNWIFWSKYENDRCVKLDIKIAIWHKCGRVGNPAIAKHANWQVFYNCERDYRYLLNQVDWLTYFWRLPYVKTMKILNFTLSLISCLQKVLAVKESHFLWSTSFPFRQIVGTDQWVQKGSLLT